MTEHREKLRNVNDADFQSRVLSSPIPVLVDFWADWCGPCRMLETTIQALADDYGSRLSVVKINIDENPGTALTCGVRSIPTLILFMGGQPAATVVGVRSQTELSEFIDRHMT